MVVGVHNAKENARIDKTTTKTCQFFSLQLAQPATPLP